MNKKELEKLIEERNDVNNPKCPYKDCCDYEQYASCYSHSHILCTNFERWYNSKQERKTPKNGWESL